MHKETLEHFCTGNEENHCLCAQKPLRAIPVCTCTEKASRLLTGQRASTSAGLLVHVGMVI